MKRWNKKRRSGFTLLEMMAGLAIVALAVGAAAAFTIAMADAWRASEASGSVRSSALQGTNRIQQMIKESKYLGWGGTYGDGVNSGVLLWSIDRDDAGKGTMQLSEIALLEYSSTDQQVRLLELDPASVTGQQIADLDDIDQIDDVTAFKALPDMTQKVLMRDVKSGKFKARNNDVAERDNRPLVEFVIETAKHGKSQSEYQTATVRAPTSKPAKCHSGSCPCTSGDPTHCGSKKSCGCGGSKPCRASTTTPCGVNGTETASAQS